jgi:transposase
MITALTPQGYPAAWPKPAKGRPASLVSKVTDEEKRQLYNRQLTTRDLAKRYGVREAWASTLFPGKIPTMTASIKNKKALKNTRREFRTGQAALVLEGRLSTREASVICRVSYRSMARAVQALKLSTKATGEAV